MGKRWKPTRQKERDWPVMLLIGGAVVWAGLLVGLLLSTYVAPG